MGSIRRFLVHPITLVGLAIALGIGIHQWRNPGIETGRVTSNVQPVPVGTDGTKSTEGRPSPADSPQSDPAGSPQSGPAGSPQSGTEGGSRIEVVEEKGPPENADELKAPPADAAPSPGDPSRSPERSPERSLAPAETGRAEVLGAAKPRAVPHPPTTQGLSPVAFREIWAYLMVGEEKHWTQEAAVTDVGLFEYRLDDVGRPFGYIPASTIRLVRRRGARAHLCVASSGQKSLLHFLLDPKYGARPRFISDLVELARKYPVDGFQLDFESLRAEDREHYIAFLRDLRMRLPTDMTFSLAMPARHREKLNDAFRYQNYRGLADRYFIMVYDEHWSGGDPGSVSGREWHDRVVRHALAQLSPEKVIVGLPLYGRLWQLDTVAKATRYSQMAEIVPATFDRFVHDPDRTHHYRFTTTVRAEGWFEDATTLHRKFSSGWNLGVRAVGFWRLGQEDTRLWSLLEVLDSQR